MSIRPSRGQLAAMALAVSFALPAAAQNIAVVNNKPIPSAKVEAVIKELIKQGQTDSPQLREAVKQELITREIFVQAAEQKGLDKSAEFKIQMENARTQILAGSLIQDYLKNHPVKDADVQAEYERVKREAGDKEYKVRHILVEKEDEAKAIIADLKKGGKFDELAKKSKDPGSGGQGGDLGWQVPGSLVKPFADAMMKLGKGQTTDAPVQSQFGWHVIRLEDTRETKLPPLTEVRPQIEEQLRRKKLAEFQQELRSKAKIQ